MRGYLTQRGVLGGQVPVLGILDQGISTNGDDNSVI
jgi:hypothetical protein